MSVKSSKKKRKDRVYASAKKRAKTHQSGFERTTLLLPAKIPIFRCKEGTHLIDIVPFFAGERNKHAEEGELWYESTFFVHRNVDGENSYVCLEKTFGKKCPVCEHRARLGRDPESDSDLIKSMYPKERQLFYVIDRTTTAEKKKGVQLWDMSYHLFGKLLDEMIDNVDEDDPTERRRLSFYHLAKGMSLKLIVKEKSMGVGKPFPEVTAIEFKKRETQYDEDDEMFADLPCLDDIPKELSYKELREKLLQLGEGDDEDDDDDDEGEPKPKKSKSKPSDDDEDEDEEEDDDDSEDDDDDSEEDDESEIEVGDIVTFKYKGKKFTGKVKSIHPKTGIVSVKCEDRLHAVEPDKLTIVEPDDEEDEDEDDEPAPPKKSKAKSKPKPSDDDDDEDEDEDDEEEDEDEEEDDEPPKKSKSKKSHTGSPAGAGGKKGKKSAKDEEEDEEEDDIPFDDEDDDDDEDERPRKSKKSKR